MNLKEKVIYLLARGYEEIENLKLLHRRLSSVLAVVMMKRDIAKHDVEKMMENLHLKCGEYEEKLREQIKISAIEKETKVKECKEDVANLITSVSQLCEYSEKLLQLENADKCCLASIESSFQEEFKKITDIDMTDLPILKLVEPKWNDLFANNLFGHLQTTDMCQMCGNSICTCHNVSPLPKKKMCNKQTQTPLMPSPCSEDKKRKYDSCVSLGLDRINSVAGRIYNFHMKNFNSPKRSSKNIELCDANIFNTPETKNSSFETLANYAGRFSKGGSVALFQTECLTVESRSDLVISPESNLQKTKTISSSSFQNQNLTKMSDSKLNENNIPESTSKSVAPNSAEKCLNPDQKFPCKTKLDNFTLSSSAECHEEPRIGDIFQKAMNTYNNKAKLEPVTQNGKVTSPSALTKSVSEDWGSEEITSQQQGPPTGAIMSSKNLQALNSLNSNPEPGKSGIDILSRLKQSKKDTSTHVEEKMDRKKEGQSEVAVNKKESAVTPSSSSNTEIPHSIIERHLNEHPGTALDAKFVCSIGQTKEAAGRTLSYPIGLTTNTEGEIIVADTGNRCMKIFNIKGECTKVFGKQHQPTMSRPSAVVTNNNDDIFVKDDHGVHVFDKHGNFLRAFGHGNLIAPYGLAWTKEGYLIILDACFKRPSLKMYSQKGELLTQFAYRPIQMASPQSKCRFLAVSGKQVVVSDLGLNSVYVTGLDGSLIAKFGSYGKRPSEFREPSGVAVDIDGNILVADSKNDRVQVWKENKPSVLWKVTCIIDDMLGNNPYRQSDLCYNITPLKQDQVNTLHIRRENKSLRK